jgi:hypothetical protein
MPPFCTLGFFAVEHDPVFDLSQGSQLHHLTRNDDTLALLYNPLPSGSDKAITRSSFIDFMYRPTPAIVPPVPVTHNILIYAKP